MGQNARIDQSQRGFVTIDWMVLAVACIAVLFLIGTMIRVSVDADEVRTVGFSELAGDDTLLAFQDFSFDATGWDPSDTSDSQPGLGPVLGPFVGEAVQRSFAMPTDPAIVHVTFDLHLIGAWAGQGDFHISVGGEEVLTIGLPADAGAGADAIELEAAEISGLRIAVDRNAVSPRRAEATLPGGNDDFVTLRIGLHVTEPDETLALRLMAEAEGDARWTLDNLTVVATSGDGVALR